MSMFDDALLDSSPERAPVLKPVHWWISLGVGLAGFVLGYFGLGLIFSGTQGGALVTQSTILAVLFFFWAMFLCYTWADARHLGLSAVGWFIVVLLLNLAGFIIYLVYSAWKTKEWTRATLPLAYIFEALIIGVVVLIPLVYTQELPKTQLVTMLMAPPPPPPPPPPPQAAAPKVQVHRVTVQEMMRAPTVIPKTIAQIKEAPLPPGSSGTVGGVEGGMPGGLMGGVIGGLIGSSAPPPPPPPKPAAPKRIRVGGQVEAAKVIFGPQPEYPSIAKMARVQGVVRLAAVISENGTIQDLRLISGPPLLVKSAMDAVSRWRYQPTLLNGDPVQVETEIDVNFTLQE
jgi:periplasmic protein TonB